MTKVLFLTIFCAVLFITILLLKCHCLDTFQEGKYSHCRSPGNHLHRLPNLRLDWQMAEAAFLPHPPESTL